MSKFSFHWNKIVYHVGTWRIPVMSYKVLVESLAQLHASIKTLVYLQCITIVFVFARCAPVRKVPGAGTLRSQTFRRESKRNLLCLVWWTILKNATNIRVWMASLSWSCEKGITWAAMTCPYNVKMMNSFGT